MSVYEQVISESHHNGIELLVECESCKTNVPHSQSYNNILDENCKTKDDLRYLCVPCYEKINK